MRPTCPTLWICFIGISAGCGSPTETDLLPEPPSGLAIQPVQRTVDGNLYQLSWTAPSASTVRSFVIEVGSSPGAVDVQAIERPASETGYLFATQFRGPVFIRIRARNRGGDSEPAMRYTRMTFATRSRRCS